MIIWFVSQILIDTSSHESDLYPFAGFSLGYNKYFISDIDSDQNQANK